MTNDITGLPTCISCPYFAASKSSPGKGECRRHSPRAIIFAQNNWADNFAPVEPDDWCGDHPTSPEFVGEWLKYQIGPMTTVIK